MFGKKKEVIPPVEEKKEEPAPAYLRPDYPFKAVGEALEAGEVEDGVVYEIKCNKCEMSIRSQGQNIRRTWNGLKESGCIGCKNKELVIKRVDMSAVSANPITPAGPGE